MRISFFLALLSTFFCYPTNLLSNTETDSLKHRLHFAEGSDKPEVLQDLADWSVYQPLVRRLLQVIK